MRLRERILRLIARTACNHSRAVLGVFVLVTAFSVAVIAVRGKVSTDLTDVLPTKSEECALYVEAAETFASDFLLVVLEGRSPVDQQQIDAVRALIDRIGTRRPEEMEDLAAVLALLSGAAPTPGEREKAVAAARKLELLADPESIGELESIVDRMSGGFNDPSDIRELKRLLDRLAAPVADQAAAGGAQELLKKVAYNRPGGPADIDAAKPFVDRLAARLTSSDYKDFVKSVEYKVGEEARRFVRELAEERGYLYLDAEDRRLIAGKLTTAAVKKQMAANRAKLDAAGIDFFERRIVPDPLNFFEVLKRHRASAGGGFVPKEGESYLISPDGTLLLMMVQATEPVKDTSFNERFMAAIERAEAETWDEFVPAVETEAGGTFDGLSAAVPSKSRGGGDLGQWEGLRARVQVKHAGAYAVAVDQNRMLVSDLGKSFVMSLVCVMIIFALGFRRLGALFYIGFPLIASVTWTLAAAFLAFGHISMMSGGFAAILVGLSVDFAIHIYNRYVTERAEGAETPEAIEGALAATGSGIFFGAVTSSVAFFGVMLTRFVGLSEFGFLAGIGVLFGMTAMFFVLPALLHVRSTIGEEPANLTKIYGFRLDKVAGVIDRRPGLVFGVSASLALAAAVFVYTTMTEHFFDSDLKNLRAESPVIDLVARIQQKFGTSLAKMIVLSRGETEEEVLEKAGDVLARAERIVEGVVVERAPWPEGAPASGRPFIRVDGCIARVRRVEIALPAGTDPPSPRARSTVLMTQPDGSRLLVYSFPRSSSKEEMADWEFEGAATYMGGAELRPAGDGTGALMRWKHELAVPAEIAFSVRYLGKVRRVTLGLGKRVAISADVEDAPEKPTGDPWPPAVEDQVRMTLTAGPERGIELAAGRGTVTGVDSVARLVPPLSRQKASAAFVAGIDVDRVEDDIGAAARANRISPEAFEEFVERLRDMAERAREPRYLTLAEITATKFGAALKKYYAKAPKPAREAGAAGPEGTPAGSVHTIATFLYPERGEQPREWFQRVDLSVGEGGDLTAPRLISLAIRDIVHQDFSWLTILVFAGVAIVLLWSFRSIVWSAAALTPVFASFALMLATMLLVRHRLNFLNVLVFPILVGIGIDYGIHVVHRFRQSVPVRDIITETGRAFVLTSLTTIAGFGSLVISSYKGLSSFGFVTILGMTFVLLTSLIALPSGLRLVELRRASSQPRVAGAEGDGDKAEGSGT